MSNQGDIQFHVLLDSIVDYIKEKENKAKGLYWGLDSVQECRKVASEAMRQYVRAEVVSIIKEIGILPASVPLDEVK